MRTAITYLIQSYSFPRVQPFADHMYLLGVLYGSYLETHNPMTMHLIDLERGKVSIEGYGG